ncbi:glycosyltransferase [Pelagibius litoralis]|uniref:Glycosyltransferase n=1 Tax=Pelagibius litoralis TaxID=374515 RepID=A0A967K9Y2_9PROT|nr:glycosyltransferase [Pelagibius litoralis]NIA69569.1 glycosyltransferase [Pelagibius litoralis]
MQPPKERVPASIIIANYNYARFLERCIDSALNQNHADVEVIVVDDASSDESSDVIRSYGSRVIACLKASNGGHAAAFNTGFAACSGVIVFFLDADDYLYPNAVSEVIDACDRSTTQAQFRLHVVDEDRGITDTYPPPELPFDDGNVMPELLRRGRYQTTVTSGLAFDRTTLESILPIPESEFRQGADGYLATVAPMHGKVTSIDACLGAYRQHGANHSAFDDKLAERARWRIQHDFHRLAALCRQTAELGVILREDVCLRDPAHLQERLASVCVDKARHPVADDSKLALGRAGAAASLEMNASFRRRAFLAAWFLSVGVLPRRMARAVLSWKLVASSRPRLLSALSKIIRRAIG